MRLSMFNARNLTSLAVALSDNRHRIPWKSLGVLLVVSVVLPLAILTIL